MSLRLRFLLFPSSLIHNYTYCALKFNKGVEKVTCDADSKKLTVIGKVDPVMLKEKVEQKTHKNVELVSPVPKKDGKGKGGGGGDSAGGAGEEKKKQNKEKDAKENKGGEEDKKTKEKEVLQKLLTNCRVVSLVVFILLHYFHCYSVPFCPFLRIWRILAFFGVSFIIQLFFSNSQYIQNNRIFF